MLRIVTTNLLLFIAFLILFIILATGIGYAMGAANNTIETALAYIGVWLLHLYINARLLRKYNLASIHHRVVAVILITCAYIAYVLFIRLIFN
jgi:hypothetical protein